MIAEENTDRCSQLLSQLQHLERNNMRDTEKYKQLYQELKNLRSGNKMIDEGMNNPPVQIPASGLADTITEQQVYQVQQQIHAYKHLIRNMNIPDDTEKNIFSLTTEQWDDQKKKLIEKSLSYYNDKVSKNEDLKKFLQRFSHKKKSGQPDNAANGAQPNDQQNYPEYQKFIESNQYFVERRKTEIKDYIEGGQLTEEAQTKLRVEQKFLDTFGFYHKMKEQMMKSYIKNKPERTFERVLLDRKFYTRDRPVKKQEHKMMEQIESKIKNEQEQRKKIRHREFLQQLYSHQVEFFEFHKRKAKLIKKRGNGVKAHLEMLEKRGKMRRKGVIK